MNNTLLLELWEQAGAAQLILAAISGMIVSVVYFGSLRWSIEHLAKTKHKIALYGGVALLRILLFFGVLVAVSGRNIAVVLIYVVVFFISRVIVFALDRKHFLHENTDEGSEDA